MNDLATLPCSGERITIGFTDCSKSQSLQCTLPWTDGRNTVVYDEEGNPLLMSNSAYVLVKKGWRVRATMSPHWRSVGKLFIDYGYFYG